MKIPIYQVDAFTSHLFRGNPAAVCPLESWLDDALMLNVARENNLAETAFFVRNGNDYELRWFTPEVEIDLCGHATLASAYVIAKYIEPGRQTITFSTKSGRLDVQIEDELISLFFPKRPAMPCTPPPSLAEALGAPPVEVLKARDYLVVLSSENQVRDLKPNLQALLDLDALGVIVCAKGEEADFVSRFFAPGAGIPEDPVTGSAHCTLIPYWSHQLGKTKLYAQQISSRGGELYCEDLGNIVRISGKAVSYLEGFIHV